MAERAEHPHGAHCWVHLSTPDAAGAQDFYGGLFGWSFTPVAAGGPVMATLGEHAVAVIIPNPSLPPHWNSYVAVDSADEVAARVTPNGGTLLEPAFDVPGGSGRMAHLLDPMGAPLTLWQAGDHPGAGLVNAPGALTWNDLNTTGPAVAAAFYSTLLGWEFEQLDVEGFEYWAITNDGRPNGGMRPIDPVLQEGVPSHWMPYFGAEDVSVAEARVRRLGGQVHFGPVDVPDGGAFVVAGDPQGGVFALFSGDFDD